MKRSLKEVISRPQLGPILVGLPWARLADPRFRGAKRAWGEGREEIQKLPSLGLHSAFAVRHMRAGKNPYSSGHRRDEVGGFSKVGLSERWM